MAKPIDIVKKDSFELGSLDKITPSQLPFSAFALCPPFYIDASIRNNQWMVDMKEDIGVDKFVAQWFDFYQFLSSNALVLLIPPVKGFQDQTYVNSFAYLPHIKNKNIVILSNFKGKGRAGEEIIAGKFLESYGYETVKCPFNFEGEPELKYLTDNLYLGGYGQRTDKKALDWITEKYGANIIQIHEQDPYLYHLDCSVFVINKDNIIMHTKGVDKKTLKQIEKHCTIHSVSTEAAYQGIANSLRLDAFIMNASSLKFMKKTSKWYKEEKQKNDELEAIAGKLGFETIFFDMSEATKSGALLSCFVAHLNYRDLLY